MAYWKDYDKMYDYFLIDYFMDLIYENNSMIKQFIEDIPYNETPITQLQQLMAENGNRKKVEALLEHPHNYFNKLTYKRPMK